MERQIYKKEQGFSLIELMTVIVIAGILLSIGVPSYQEFVRKNNTITNSNSLVGALNLARSEAIKRGIQVTIRRKGSTSQVWTSGWDVFTDNDANGAMNGGDSLLRTYDALPNNYTLQTGGTFADWVAYLPSGLSKGSGGLSNDTFRLCDDSANTATSRSVRLSVSGRPRTIKGTVSCP